MVCKFLWKEWEWLDEGGATSEVWESMVKVLWQLNLPGLNVCHYEQHSIGYFVRAWFQEAVATRPGEAGWCIRHCNPFMIKYLLVLMLGLHQPLRGFWFLPGGSRAVLWKCGGPDFERHLCSDALCGSGTPSLPPDSAFSCCFSGEGVLQGSLRAVLYLCLNLVFHGSVKAM